MKKNYGLLLLSIIIVQTINAKPPQKSNSSKPVRKVAPIRSVGAPAVQFLQQEVAQNNSAGNNSHIVEQDNHQVVIEERPLEQNEQVDPTVDKKVEQGTDGSVTETVTTTQVEDDKVVTKTETWRWYDYAKVAAGIGLAVGAVGAAYYHRDALNNQFNNVANYFNPNLPAPVNSVANVDSLSSFAQAQDDQSTEQNSSGASINSKNMTDSSESTSSPADTALEIAIVGAVLTEEQSRAQVEQAHQEVESVTNKIDETSHTIAELQDQIDEIKSMNDVTPGDTSTDQAAILAAKEQELETIKAENQKLEQARLVAQQAEQTARAHAAQQEQEALEQISAATQAAEQEKAQLAQRAQKDKELLEQNISAQKAEIALIQQELQSARTSNNVPEKNMSAQQVAQMQQYKLMLEATKQQELQATQAQIQELQQARLGAEQAEKKARADAQAAHDKNQEVTKLLEQSTKKIASLENKDEGMSTLTKLGLGGAAIWGLKKGMGSQVGKKIMKEAAGNPGFKNGIEKINSTAEDLAKKVVNKSEWLQDIKGYGDTNMQAIENAVKSIPKAVTNNPQELKSMVNYPKPKETYRAVAQNLTEKAIENRKKIKNFPRPLTEVDANYVNYLEYNQNKLKKQLHYELTNLNPKTSSSKYGENYLYPSKTQDHFNGFKQEISHQISHAKNNATKFVQDNKEEIRANAIAVGITGAGINVAHGINNAQSAE